MSFCWLEFSCSYDHSLASYKICPWQPCRTPASDKASINRLAKAGPQHLRCLQSAKFCFYFFNEGNWRKSFTKASYSSGVKECLFSQIIIPSSRQPVYLVRYLMMRARANIFILLKGVINYDRDNNFIL